MVKKMQKRDPKWILTTVAQSVPASGDNGQVTLLNGCQQGTDANKRIGDTTRMWSISCKGKITLNASETDGVIVRLILVIDRNCNAATPAWTDLCENATAISLYKSSGATKGRFSVLFDKFVRIDETTKNVPFKFFKKLKNYPVDYSLASYADIRDIKSGGLFLMSNGCNNDQIFTVDAYTKVVYGE